MQILNIKQDTTTIRSSEYPPLQDLADALYWQSKGDSTKMNAYIQKCDDVKVKYPKPSSSGGNGNNG
jgi:hypothetical protein